METKTSSPPIETIRKLFGTKTSMGKGTFGPKQVVSKPRNGANNVIAADLDADCNLDVISSSINDAKVAWNKNGLLPQPTTVSIDATDNTATEARLSTGLFMFSRNANTSMPLVVNFQVTGTATPNRDYVDLGTNVEFPTGAARVNQTVTPIQDMLQETNEPIVLTLLPSEDYQIGVNSSATVNIVSDEAITQRVSVRTTDNMATEAGLTNGTFTFTRTGNTATALTVNFEISGTAKPGIDYVNLGTAVRFPARTTTVTKTVTPKQDSIQESQERVVLKLTESPFYAVVAPKGAMVSIISDE